MNRILMQRVGKKFYGHDTLKSKYEPQIPLSAEREYVRTVDDYMRIVKSEVEEHLPKLKEIYKENRDAEVRTKQRYDSEMDLILSISEIFNVIENNIVSKTIGFGLRHRLESLAHLTRKLSVKEWKKAIKATLGINILEDYYLGDFYKEQLGKWVDENIGLISTIPEETLEKMKDIVYDGFSNGKTTTRLVKEIQRAYGIGRRHAELIARDQTAKLNGHIQQAQQQDAGIIDYVWSDSGDVRVRRSHKELNGKIFSWSQPPLNSDGRRCHPGEDYQCRCIGRPIFNRNINLPVADNEPAQVTIRKKG
jgi:SPP1 gp7 family putative phage head morphogenesis protein